MDALGEPEVPQKPDRDYEAKRETKSVTGKDYRDSDEKGTWQESPAFVIVLLVVFFPAGIYFLWKSSRFKLSLKIVLTGLAVCFAAGCIYIGLSL